MPVHDATASVVALARTILMGLDPNRIETPVQTESLRLILTTFIDTATPQENVMRGQAAERSVMSGLALVNGAQKSRGS